MKRPLLDHVEPMAIRLRGLADRDDRRHPMETHETTDAKMLRDAAGLLEDLDYELRTAATAWQPIETAPRDGRTLLLYGLQFRRHIFGKGYYFKGVPGDGEGWIAHSFYTQPKDDVSGCFEPTHWQPMLQEPAQ